MRPPSVASVSADAGLAPVSARAAPAPPPGVRRSTRYVPEVESLRGIAIILVVLYHADSVVIPGGTRVGTLVSPWQAFVLAGHTGVSLFFVLSAFLLSLPFLAEAGGGKRVERGDYYRRRALRILPLYYTAVAISGALSAQRAADLLRVLPYLGFLNSFAGLATPLFPYSAVWWSLATEVQFYLVLPLLPYVLRSARGRWCGGIALMAYVAGYIAFGHSSVGVYSLSSRVNLVLSLFGRAPLFGLGIACAWVYSRHGERLARRLGRSRALRNGGADVLLLAVLATLGFLLRMVVFRGVIEAELVVHTWHLLEGVSWALVLLLILLAPVHSKPLLSNSLLRTVGVLSYSIYLVHFPLLWVGITSMQHRWLTTFARWNIISAGVAAALIAACVGVSAVTYRYIERPFLVRKARIDR